MLQSLHCPFMCMQNWFVIGQVIIFFFSQRVRASLIALETSFSIELVNCRSLGFS
jgi:hypothetical protein